jgi:hypothetical protein
MEGWWSSRRRVEVRNVEGEVLHTFPSVNTRTKVSTLAATIRREMPAVSGWFELRQGDMVLDPRSTVGDLAMATLTVVVKVVETARPYRKPLQPDLTAEPQTPLPTPENAKPPRAPRAPRVPRKARPPRAPRVPRVARTPLHNNCVVRVSMMGTGEELQGERRMNPRTKVHTLIRGVCRKHFENEPHTHFALFHCDPAALEVGAKPPLDHALSLGDHGCHNGGEFFITRCRPKAARY